jgi:hypothetical protein
VGDEGFWGLTGFWDADADGSSVGEGFGWLWWGGVRVRILSRSLGVRMTAKAMRWREGAEFCGESIPQGLKPSFDESAERPKPEGLGYLETR